MSKQVPHEITLVAFCRHEDGSKSVMDIVQTSRHFASHFTRRWVADPEIWGIAAAAPHHDLGTSPIRELRR